MRAQFIILFFLSIPTFHDHDMKLKLENALKSLEPKETGVTKDIQKRKMNFNDLE